MRNPTFYQKALWLLMRGDSPEQLEELLHKAVMDFELSSQNNLSKTEANVKRLLELNKE